MKITVLHGSPKGDISVTMQYVRYLEKMMPEHVWTIEQVSSQITKLENDVHEFERLMGSVQNADVVLWSFPLYHLLVPSQMKRFIELVRERGAADSFFGKYSAAIMTSIHYYDHTARNYIHAVSEDLGMRFSGAFTPEMEDLTKANTRKNLVLFAQQVMDDCLNNRALPAAFPALKVNDFVYSAVTPVEKIAEGSLRVRIIYDGFYDSNAKAMAERLCSRFDAAEMVDISAIHIKGGCLGCLKCGSRNVCVYDGSDDYRSMHRQMILNADIIFFAGAVRDRYLSSKMKQFFDRSFYINHKPVLEGKQIGWIVSGPLGQIPNLRQIMEAYADVSRGNLAGIVTDESADSAFIDAQIDALALRTVSSARSGYVSPTTFLGDGGRRIFRDEIWGGMRIVFAEDYRHYKKHGMFNFPQKKIVNWTGVPLLSALMKIPSLRKVFDREVKRGMIMPLKKVVDKA
jgi:multimeric flavodoxin WrbA